MAYTRIRSESPESNEKPVASRRSSLDTSRFSSYRSLFAVTFALWIATSTILSYTVLRRPPLYENHAATSLPFPPVPSRIVMFNPDSRFHYTAPDTGGAAWSSLMPNDGGILSIQNPQQYQLPASYKDRNSSHAEVYSMSMFHQLHCLENSIRVRLGTREGLINATDSESHHRRNVFAPESHAEHCFDYLRQAIMCAGDLSLEHSVVLEEFGFNGWGTAHQCADWDSMWNIAVERRYEQSVMQSGG